MVKAAVFALLGAATAGYPCLAHAGAAAGAGAAAPASLASEVNAMARPHCGSCHQSSLPTASPRALAVFDLDHDDWSAGLSARQLRSFLGRLDGKLDAARRARVSAFIDAAIARLPPAR
jgi:hypothetical protein